MDHGPRPIAHGDKTPPSYSVRDPDPSPSTAQPVTNRLEQNGQTRSNLTTGQREGAVVSLSLLEVEY